MNLQVPLMKRRKPKQEPNSRQGPSATSPASAAAASRLPQPNIGPVVMGLRGRDPKLRFCALGFRVMEMEIGCSVLKLYN